MTERLDAFAVVFRALQRMQTMLPDDEAEAAILAWASERPALGT